MKDKLLLTDLIEIEILQKIQDAFSELTGMAALTTDTNGVAITEGSGFTDFCMKYTRQSKLGCQECEQCDRKGAEQAQKDKKSCFYYCHAGLIDFAAPIIANEELIGCFIGGQALTEKMDEEKLRQTAERYDINPEEYIEAAKKVTIVPQEKVDHAAKFLYVVAEVLSRIAYRGYQDYLSRREMEGVSQMKSDFLANMSHEIRTPMNAVIGMSEMALREEMTPSARNYIHQIKSSSEALLRIINDILDFSKIESGKMTITEVDYEPMSIINDMVNIIMTRIGDKDVEFTMNIPMDLPLELRGDNIRMKQIIVNLANNAVKFTQHGEVHLDIRYEYISDDVVDLCVDVRDTGSGIKKSDLPKLFQSFQQVDSKRNRNQEGTGLGLAISKQLLLLMGGDVEVDSEYGKGSVFSLHLPQTVIRKEPSIPQLKEKPDVLMLIDNSYVQVQLEKDMQQMGVPYQALQSEDDLTDYMDGQNAFLFVDRPLFSENIQSFLIENANIIGILLVGFRHTTQYAIPNLRIVKKPIYPLNLISILSGKEILSGDADSEETIINFTAPEAEVLIVDDNEVNLTVAAGLLEPLKMRIDTAMSGKEAISMVSHKHYDLIFMDHMMPEVDGVETTHIIRRFYDTYVDVPIIALTANAISGMREMFIKEGMNDFVAKPIEMKVIVAKLRHWLPPEKIKLMSDSEAQAALNQKKEEESEIQIEGLDINTAMSLLGSKKLFWAALKEYFRTMDKKSEWIKRCEMEEEWRDFTVEVHALKSASRQVGAMELAGMAEKLEKAGNEEDAQYIHSHTDTMLEKYRWHQKMLMPYFSVENEKSEPKSAITQDILVDLLEQMSEAVDELDGDLMESVQNKIESYVFDESQEHFVEELREAVDGLDTEACENIVSEWEKML